MKTLIVEKSIVARTEGRKVVEAWIEEVPHHAEILGIVSVDHDLWVVLKYTKNDNEEPTLKRVPLELVFSCNELKDTSARYLGSHKPEYESTVMHVFLPTPKD